MAFDKKTRKFSEEEKRLPRSRTDRSRSFDKSSKAYPAEREQHTSRGYQQFEYKNSLPERNRESREIVQKAKEQKIQVQIVDKSRLDAIAPNHQGLIAFASAYQYASVDDILNAAYEKGEEPFLILLDGITDPHNLGAIIRTAECTGVHGIIIPQHRSVGLTPSAVKSSAGAVEYVKVARVNNLSRTIEYLQQKNIWMYAVTMNGNDYREISFKGGVALVIGAEEDGISRLVAEKCDYAVSLPMTGKIESLNASVAAGIMMYRVLECRK